MDAHRTSTPRTFSSGNGKGKGTRATVGQTVKMYDLIKTHFLVEEGRYEEGWSDVRIAREVDPTLSPNTATRVRVQEFGKVLSHVEGAATRKRRVQTGGEVGLNHLAALEEALTQRFNERLAAEVGRLSDNIVSLHDAHTRLADTVTAHGPRLRDLEAKLAGLAPQA